MYLTIHGLDRVLTRGQGDDWAGDVLAVLTREGLRPAAAWVGLQDGTSRGSVIALWTAAADAAVAGAAEGSTSTRITVSPGVPRQVIDVSFGPDGARPASVIQLAYFDGPRSAVQVAADRRSDHRIGPAVETVPAYCGSITGLAEDGGYVVVVLATSDEALAEGQRRIMSTELLPGEDPALLSGPDLMERLSVVRATTSLSTVSTLLTEGVR